MFCDIGGTHKFNKYLHIYTLYRSEINYGKKNENHGW